MSFTPLIPASGQTLGNSRTQILNNFSNYNTVMSVNHVSPNSSGQGKHTFVEMPVQGSTPSTLSGEGGLYTKTISGGTASILYYQRDANTSVNQPVLPMACGSFIIPACTQVSGYNVTSMVRTGAGQYTVNLAITLPFSAGTQEYIVIPSIVIPTSGGPTNSAAICYVFDLTASSFKLQIRNGEGVLGDNGNRLMFTVIQ